MLHASHACLLSCGYSWIYPVCKYGLWVLLNTPPKNMEFWIYWISLRKEHCDECLALEGVWDSV